LDQLAERGFQVVPPILDSTLIANVVSAIELATKETSTGKPAGYALRNLAQSVPEVLELSANSKVRALVDEVLGPSAFLVRSQSIHPVTPSPLPSWAHPSRHSDPQIEKKALHPSLTTDVVPVDALATNYSTKPSSQTPPASYHYVHNPPAVSPAPPT
jgi:hypothetical protein